MKATLLKVIFKFCATSKFLSLPTYYPTITRKFKWRFSCRLIFKDQKSTAIFFPTEETIQHSLTLPRRQGGCFRETRRGGGWEPRTPRNRFALRSSAHRQIQQCLEGPAESL